ncbi:hypothetical protein BDW59DRAFT_152586 [Aspergillus cavernicola]|uniref:NmrA-like domain-containing protein n=1 Tax=Aspergillus cavernicola TaxID=176166 RepID=A0ABR4HS73_9EURO
MPTTTTNDILVIGAGELGTQVLLSLAQHPNASNKNIAALLRPSTITSPSPQKTAELQTLRDSHISLIPGDITNDTPDTLSSVFANYHTVISCTGFAAGSGTQRKLARAVLAADVPRFIPWQFGVDYDTIGRGSGQDLFDEQLDVRDLLRSQEKTKWAIISTGMFTSFLFEPSFGVVDLQNAIVTALGGLANRVTVTSPGDIGRLAAEAVLGPNTDEVFGNKAIYVAGDTLSYERLAELLEMVTGRTFQRKVRTVESAKADLTKEPENGLYKYQIVFGEGKGVAWDIGETWNSTLGIRAQTAEEWAKEHLS